MYSRSVIIAIQLVSRSELNRMRSCNAPTVCAVSDFIVISRDLTIFQIE